MPVARLAFPAPTSYFDDNTTSTDFIDSVISNEIPDVFGSPYFAGTSDFAGAACIFLYSPSLGISCGSSLGGAAAPPGGALATVTTFFPTAARILNLPEP